MKTKNAGLVLKVVLGWLALGPCAWAVEAPAATVPRASIHGTKSRKSVFSDPQIVGVAAIDTHVIPKAT